MVDTSRGGFAARLKATGHLGATIHNKLFKSALAAIPFVSCSGVMGALQPPGGYGFWVDTQRGMGGCKHACKRLFSGSGDHSEEILGFVGLWVFAPHGPDLSLFHPYVSMFILQL